MAIYAELFDGTRLEFPDGTDPAVIDRVAREETLKRQPKVAPPEPKESTILGEAKRGFQQFLSGARTGAGAVFGSPEEAARAGLERSEKIEAEAGEGPSLERAKRVYEERGLLPAAGQVLSDIPRLLAQQGTQIGATIGGAKVGAGIGAAVAGPPGALIGGGLGAIGANVPSMFGQAMQRQAATQMEEGKPVDISMGRAAAATAGSAALEAAGTAGVLGKNLVKRLLGVGDDAALAAARSKEDLVKAARATIAGGAVRGAAVEMPVEVAQSVLDRWQAGLDVTGDDALKEYGESLYAAGLVGGPVGGASAIPTRRAAQRALEEQEPLAPGQRRGETLEQTANRLNTEVQGLTGELQPPPPSPFLSPEQLASIAASENGFGKLVQYEEKIKQEPSSPERNASLQASREFRRRLEIESQQRQTEPGKAYPFDPYAPEPFQFKSSTELVDLINKIDDPADKLTRILEYRAEVKAQPASAAREQALKDSSALYDEVNKFVQAQGFPAPTPFTLRTSDLTAAGIDRKDPLFEQLKGKDINKPDDVDTVVKLTEEAQRRPNITPELFDRLEGLLTSVEAHIRDLPGSGFYGQRTYPKPSGTGVSVAGQPEPTVPSGGAEPSGRMGMVGPTAPAEPTVSRKKVAPTSVAPVAKPNYAEMTLEQLQAARDNADQVNLQLDLNAIRKYLGEDAAKKYEAMNRRARDNWWDKNATDALERESSVFQGVNEETIDEYIQAINKFDPTSPKDLGRSIALIAKDIDQPNFRGSPEFVTLRNALTFAKQQGWSEREVLDAMRGRAAEWAGADAKELFNSLFKSAPAAERKPAAPALPATQEPPPVPSVEPAYEPGLEVGLSERVQELETELRKLEAERGQVVKLNPGPNLFTAVKGKLARSDVIDIGTDRHFRLLTNAQGRGTFVSELVNNSQLDVWLPPDKRPESNSYDAQESEEYIKDLLRNREHIPFAVKETIDRLDLQIANLDQAIETEAQLENLIRKANAELQVAAEERRAEEAELPSTGREVGSVKRAEKPAARAQLGKPEPLTIDVEARVIEETVGPQVAKLPASQVALLEAHYGEKAGTQSFLDKVKEDVVLFANKGASAVAEAIRAVIKAIHAGVVSVSLIFNPINISQPEAFLIVPKAEAKTETVKPAEAPEVAKPKAAKLAQVPDNVEGMSDAARQAYQTLIPSLKDSIGDKLIVIADKPSARLFVFTPDGELVVQNKALFGAAKGDLYNGNVNVPSNRITPAGLFGLKLVDAKAGPSAKRTAGEYDFGKVFALEDPEAVITIMHSVWLKDSDAAMRQAALRSPDATDSRYSYGCINVDQATFKYLLDNYERQMDGAKMFVVPDNQAQLKEFLYGDIAKNIGGLKPGEGPDRLVREAVKRMSLAKVAPQVSEKKFQELERRAKQPSKPEPAKEEPEEVKAIRAERAEKIDQLQGVLEKILAKYGLKDVKLNLEEGMKDEGSYEGQLIKLALDLDNPVRTLRHEAIHALKELGFFTPQQWKVLTDRAKSEWIEKYLKNQSAVVDGKEVTRYDAYMDLYKGDQDKIVEEAIADAFGDFVKTKAPPGMMQAILTRMKNLFKAIKETFNQGGYQTAEDVFGKIEEGKLTKAEKLVQEVEAGAKPSLRAPDTKEFKQFFRESKVVDDKDEPLVVYHGTKTDLTEFDTDASELRGTLTETDLLSPLGSHFARDPQVANNFATKSGAVVYPVYLSIQNPKVYKKEQDLRDELIKQNIDNQDINDILENPDNYLDYAESVLYQEETFEARVNRYDSDPKYRETVNQAAYNYLRDTAEPELVVDFVKQLANSWKEQNPTIDGIIYENGAANEVKGAKTVTSYIAFNPGQIKSAIGNVGTYEGTEADIRKSLRTLPTLPTDVTDRIKQTVIPRERPGMVGRLLDAISPRTFSKFRSEFVNRYDALARFDRQAAEQIRLMGGTEQLADAKAESAALFSDLSGGLAASAMGVNDRVGGIPVYVRKYIVEKDFKKIGPDYTTKAAAEAAAKKVGGQVFEQGYTTISNANGVKGLIAIFSDLAKYKKPAENEPSVFDQYQFWADVKRASKYILNPGTGKYEEKLFTKDDIRRAAQIEQAFPEFVQIQKEWIKYNDGLVDFMRDTGVISEAGAKEMKKHGDYFPFYRHLGEDDIQGPRLFSSIANVKSVKAAKGSEAEVTDFFETIVRNTQSAIQSGIKNVAARRATDQAMRIGEVFKLNRAESGPSVYRVLENGKETYYRAQDPYFIDALKSLNQPDLPFIGLLAGPAKLLRNLVTKDPAFQLANMMRDSLSAYVSSGYKFTPIAATLKQYGSIIAGKSAEVEALRKAGVIGGYDYSQGVEASAQKLEKEMRKVAGAKTTLEKIASPVTSLWGALEKSSEASDAATRNEIYKRVLAETGNEAEALYQALEVMNFNRKGRSPIIRILTAAVPFMNARIQGLDVLYRSGMRPIFGKDATQQEKARLKTFWVRGMTMMALSSMYWVLTSDDEEYKKQEQEVRDNYWLFPSLGIKIPIPFEIGVMFKVIPERILEYSMGSDTGEDFRKSMGRHLFSTFGFNPIPQTLLPAVEITANYSFFTQRPIITQGMENISPEYQVGPNTSKIAGAIGQSLGISPIKLDYLIQGYTGTMGMYAVNLFDSIFSMNDEAPKPSRRLEQMPVLRRFMVDPEARGQITAYYDLKNSVDQVVRTSNYLERSMDFEQYGKYMQENIKMLSARDYINDLEKTMKEFREMKNLIRISKIDADEKRDSLTNIGRMEQQLTQNIKTLKKQLAAQQ